MQRPLSPLKIAVLAIVFLWFFGGGIGHFVVTDFFISIVPPYIPYPRAVVYISGVVELVLALALFSDRLRPIVGWLLIGVIAGVSLANIHMWLHPELFPKIPYWALSLRLVIQIFLIAGVWWSTRTGGSRAV